MRRPLNHLKLLLVGVAFSAGLGGYASAESDCVPVDANADGVIDSSEQCPAVDSTPATRTAVLEDAAGQEGRNLSPEEKLTTAQRRIERMRGQLSQTTELLQKVREGDGDILRINCINEKLAAMKGFVKVSEQSYTGLRDATGQDDENAQSHHFSLISISAQKVRDLGEEAQTCVGEVQVFADEGIVDRREDPGLADVDPIEIDDDEFDDWQATDTLPELTPFQ